ncbi:MAG TPA: penicillin acylase family protein [Thermoanaerobaculia bacterium]|nr:penicillin acylase family protein [Thermoanaerobaculia bacterium]
MKIRFRKIFKFLGLSLLALLLILAVAAVWIVRRAWPQTEGTIAVAGLSAPVQVIRDEWGVPHLYAENEHDLLFAQGYVHAQDRFWQMEINRHLSGGNLARLFGKPALGIDRTMRTLGIRRAAQKDWEVLEPGTRALLEAYAEGVNAFVREGSLPVECTVLGVTPEPWTPVDTLAWSKMVSFSLGQNHTQELLRFRIAARHGDQGVRDFMPGYPGDAPVIVPPGAGGYGPPAPSPLSDPLLTNLLGEPSTARGSNNWVVHGSRTATGLPLLANDTHLGLGMPSEWYENGLHGGRFDVVGFSFPGVPFVGIGHNGRIAWGISAMNGDVQDLFVEEPGGKVQVIEEQIPLKSGKTEPLRIEITPRGPIVNEALGLDKGMPRMSLRWAALDPGRTLDALLKLNLAESWDSFRGALSLWDTPSLNFVYADVDGNIGYQSAGKLPVRAPGLQGLSPAPAAGGANEWKGFIPFAEMPSSFNPPAGYIATANNKVVGDDFPHFIARDYADPYRVKRISDVLAANRRVTVDDMKRLQADDYSLVAEKLRPYLLSVQPEDDLQKKALEQVRAWDLHFDVDSPGAAIYYAWYVTLLPEIVSDELGEELAEFRGLMFGQTPLYIRVMGNPKHPWFDDRRTAGKTETREEIVQRSFGKAVNLLKERLGDNPDYWRWGSLHTALLVHQPFGNSGIPPLMKLFNGQPVPLAGEAVTVNAETPAGRRPFVVTFGVSQRLIVDLKDLTRSPAINSSGQSAHLGHRHREDQIPLWGRVEYRPMLFGKEAVEKGAAERLTLEPAKGAAR